MKALSMWFAVVALFVGCTSGRTEMKVTAWNVQTFFDSVNDGTEYKEFASSKNWGHDAYRTRLERLCASMKKIDSDVFVLEEIENEHVVHDVAALLASDWNFRRHYHYACFAKQDGSAIGCAVLSRFPLENESVHGLYVHGAKEVMPPLRPLMQVTVLNGKHSIVLLVNHWKSKRGSDGCRSWRKRQEMVLGCRILALKDENVIACGDFNQDASEFVLASDGTVALQTFDACTFMCRGTDSSEPNRCGTYFYKEEWSELDHILYTKTVTASNFHAETDGPWCNPETHVPYAYRVWTGNGYSDHLPVSCSVSF